MFCFQKNTLMTEQELCNGSRSGVSSAKLQFFDLFDSISNSEQSLQDFAKWVDFKMAQFKVHGKMVKDEPLNCMKWMQLKGDYRVIDKSQRTATVTPLTLCSSDNTNEPDDMSDVSDEGINKRKRRRPNRHQPDRLASPFAVSEPDGSVIDEPTNHGQPLTPTHDSEPPPLVICEKSEVHENNDHVEVVNTPSPTVKSLDDVDNTAFVCPECSTSFRSCKDLDHHIETKHASSDVKLGSMPLQCGPVVPMSNPLINPYSEILRSLPFPMMSPMPGISPSPAEFANLLNAMYHQQAPQHPVVDTPKISVDNKAKRFKPSDKSSRTFNMNTTKCPDCEFTFSDVDSLKRHMHTCHNHSGFVKLGSSDHEHTYMCKFCGKNFLSYGSTWRHVNGIHFRAHRACPECHKSIGINSPMRLHYKSCPALSEDKRAQLIMSLKKDEVEAPISESPPAIA